MSTIFDVIEDYEARSERGGQLQSDRAKAMDYYLGRPFGNEVMGRSQVVSRDVSDSVEWIKPGLLRVFASGDEVVSFSPKGVEDVEAAEQETDYVNHVITQKNNWFNIAYVWFTDALIQRNGYVKAYWEEKVSYDKESYKGLMGEQIALVMQDPDIEIIDGHQYPLPNYVPQMQVDPATGQQLPPTPAPTLFDITVKKKSTYGCVKLCNIPPERTIVDPNHQEVSLENVQFFEHWEFKSLSELRADGFEIPEHMNDDTISASLNDLEEQARNRLGESLMIDVDSTNPEMKRWRVRDILIRYDANEDGIDELRHVICIGRNELLNEEMDLVNVACITPRIMPHRHIGISVADDTSDVQDIKSALERGFLDNVYHTTNVGHAVDETHVNLDDMLTSRPARIVRTQGPPSNSIMPMPTAANFAPVLEGINYFDQVREGRTGSGKQSQSLSADVLAKLPSGVAINQVMQSQQALVELTARVFAETGVKDLFRVVHALTLKNATQPDVIRLRNKWVPVDPREWKNRTDMTISVGLGTGNRDQQMMHLNHILDLQGKVLPLGLADKKTIHHSLTKYTQAAGFRDAQAFWTDPQQGGIAPPAPPPPDPVKIGELKVKQFEAQTTRMKAQSDAVLDNKKIDIDQQRVELDSRHQHADRRVDTALELAKLANSGPKTEVKFDAGEGLQKILTEIRHEHDATKAQHEERMTVMQDGFMKALQHISTPYDEVLVRGKDGKAIGKTRVPAGTLKH